VNGWCDRQIALDEEAIMRSLTQLMQLGTHPQQSSTAMMSYHVTDRLHEGRSVRVPVDGIARTVSGWLAELGTHSPMVDDLAGSVRTSDWPTAHALAELLSVDVTAMA
jgi:hypothetical protein